MACGGLWWRIIISIDCGGESSLTYVIIICNDVKRASLIFIQMRVRSDVIISIQYVIIICNDVTPASLEYILVCRSKKRS